MDDLLPDRAIAWDFDGTLIDHPASPLMWRFINSTPDRRHVIITFRTHGMFLGIARDLKRHSRGTLNVSVFDSIHGIEDAAWSAFMQCEWQRRAGIIKGPPTEDEDYYVNWKGLMCQKLGLPVLVDDNIPHTQPGCARHHINLIHPDEFI